MGGPTHVMYILGYGTVKNQQVCIDINSRRIPGISATFQVEPGKERATQKSRNRLIKLARAPKLLTFI